MSIPIIALAVITSLATLSAAAADSTSAIVHRDRAIIEAQELIKETAESCATYEGCEEPPRCASATSRAATPTSRCEVCIGDAGSVIKATVQIPFNTVLLKGLTPARGTHLTDLALVSRSSLRGLAPCRG